MALNLTEELERQYLRELERHTDYSSLATIPAGLACLIIVDAIRQSFAAGINHVYSIKSDPMVLKVIRTEEHGEDEDPNHHG